MPRPARTALLAAALVVAALATPAAANTLVLGQPDVSVTSPTGPVDPNERTALRVVVSNDGTVEQGSDAKPDYEEQVTTARNVRVRVPDGGLPRGVDVNTGTITVGRLSSPGSTTAEFDIEVGNVSPGRYRVPVVIEYSYVRAINFDRFEQPEFTDTDETVRTAVTLVVDDGARFRVVSEETNRLFAGDTGTLAFTVKNTGTRTAREVAVRLSTASAGVFFGSPSAPQGSTSLLVDSLAPGETRRLTARIGATSDVSPGQYPVDATVEFRNENGVRTESTPLRTGVVVRPERSFALRDLRTERFRVDEAEARVSGRVVNTGEGTARNVAVRLQDGGSVTPTNGESSVGNLAPGESKRVNFTVDIPADAEPGTNTFRFAVEYENAAGDLRTLDTPIRRSLAIGPERAPFEVVDVDTSVTPGGSGRLDVRVRYVGEDPISAVNAKLFVSDPLSSADDGAFLGTMEPGETGTATFRVAASGDALPKEYASSVEVRYDESDGDTRFTDGLSVGVPVEESTGGPPLPLVLGAVVLAVAVGYLVYRRV